MNKKLYKYKVKITCSDVHTLNTKYLCIGVVAHSVQEMDRIMDLVYDLYLDKKYSQIIDYDYLSLVEKSYSQKELLKQYENQRELLKPYEE